MNTFERFIVCKRNYFRFSSSQQDSIFMVRRFCNSIRLTLCAVCIAGFCSVEAQSQSFPYWDNSPDTQLTFESQIINGVGYKQDIYFATLGGLVRWNKCAGWTTIANVDANCLAIQGHSLYAAGQFTSVSDPNGNWSLNAMNIAKYDLDTGQWSVLGANNADWSNCPIQSIVADALGNVYVGLNFQLDFNQSNNISPHAIMKWDGTNWSGLGGGISLKFTNDDCPGDDGFDLNINALATDGTNIFAVGGFCGGLNFDYNISTNQVYSPCIIEWNPITNSWIPIMPALNGGCPDFNTSGTTSLAVCGSNLFVAGSFISPSYGIAQYSTVSGEALPSDSLYDGLNGYTQEYNPGFGYSLVTQNGIVYVTGAFTMIGNVSAINIAQWNSTNGTWTNMGSGLSSDGWVLAANDNAIFVSAGSVQNGVASGFTNAGGLSMPWLPSIARWVTSPDTCDVDDSFKPSTDQPVFCAALQSDGKILIGGDFSYVNGQSCPGVARLNTDGTLDTSFNATSVISNYFGDLSCGDVYCLAIDCNGEVYVGGDWYDPTNSYWMGILVRLDTYGNLDTSFPVIQTTGAFNTLTSFCGSELFVGGSVGTFSFSAFSTSPGYQAQVGGLAWIFEYTDVGVGDAGCLDDGGVPYVNGSVNAAVFQSSGNQVVGGDFIEIGGQAFENVGVTGGGGTWGANAPVYALAQQSDGKILVGGMFFTLGNDAEGSHYNIGRFNTDGTVDETFNANAIASNVDSVNSILVQSSGQIIFGADGGGYGTEALGRLNSDGSNDSSFAIPVDGGYGQVYQLLAQPDGRILIVGQFSNVGGQNHTNIARICPP
jgi:uncharacterized delta-60 repeat protein